MDVADFGSAEDDTNRAEHRDIGGTDPEMEDAKEFLYEGLKTFEHSDLASRMTLSSLSAVIEDRSNEVAIKKAIINQHLTDNATIDQVQCHK